MPKITPFLWFNFNAEEAIHFYTSVFKHTRVGEITRYGAGGSVPAGTLFSAEMEIEGQALLLLNAGPEFPFTEAISFFVHCADQAEVDTLWAQLTADGGQESQCGWLKDKFGLSWQIIPDALGRLLNNPDPLKAQRVMQAMLKMHKIDVALLQAAADGPGE